MFPIKYLENNLVVNQDGECMAYYELIPYNYSFLSPQQKMQIGDDFQQLVAQQKDGRIHALQVATESSVRQTQENSKKHVRGKLKGLAENTIDLQSEYLVNQIGDNQIDYRFFIGFKLMRSEEEVSIQSVKDNILITVKDFLGAVNHNLMGDFVTISDEEMYRFFKMEKMLEAKITRRFRFRRLQEKDFGYLIEHFYGQTIVPYYDYEYQLPKEKLGKETLIKKYDLLRLTRCMVQEHQRYLKITRENEESYVAYLVINAVVSDLQFPSSEIFYYQQGTFDFPVDTSMQVEIVANKKALSTVRNKKKELKDLDNHAWKNNTDTEEGVVTALDDVDELEAELNRTKNAMYKLSYVLRVSANTKEVLAQRVEEVKEFYNDVDIKLVRPFGDMLGLSEEFIPGGKRYMDDYVQYVTADFLAGLGFGAAQILGETEGMYIGYNVVTGKNVYINPALACQGVKGSVTNALAMAFLGSLGGGKSVCSNLLAYYTVLFGGKVLILDPKSERGRWKEDLPEIADEINIVNLTSDEENRGMLDPFVIMRNIKDAQSLAIDILTFLTGISSADGSRFPVLRKAVKNVAKREQRGLLYVIDELRAMQMENADLVAEHIESFADYDFAQLLFSDGNVTHTIGLDKLMNIVQVQDLTLPDESTTLDSYTNMERLSVAMMMVISTFALDFIYSERGIYKDVLLDEAWSFLRVAQGKALSNKLVRAGRAMQAGVDFVTQNSDDVGDEKMKNNIGLKFAFRSTDIVEIKKTLTFFGVDSEDVENQKWLSRLENGQCLMQDLYGRVGVVKIDTVFEHLFHAFDTRPPQEQEAGGAAV